MNLDDLPLSPLTQLATDAATGSPNILQKVFGTHSAPPKDMPTEATVRGEQVVAWRIYPTIFSEQVESLERSKDPKRWNVTRAAEQATGVTASGAEIALTEEDVRAMPVKTAKALLMLISLFGDVPSEVKPELVEDGDGVSTPRVARLSCGTVAFQCDILAELAAISARQRVSSSLQNLLAISDAPLHYEPTPADGWFMMEHILKPIVENGRKSLAAIRSYEFALKVQFDMRTPISVIAEAQVEYNKLFEKRAKAEKAAQAAAKQKRRKK